MYSLKTFAVVIHLNRHCCEQRACNPVQSLDPWSDSQHVSAVSMCLQVAIVPNTLSFNHVLAALLKAATQSCTPEVRVTLAESGVSVFNQMLSRGRTPPDTSTYDTLMALLTHVGAAGQALHVHQLKLQQVCHMVPICTLLFAGLLCQVIMLVAVTGHRHGLCTEQCIWGLGLCVALQQLPIDTLPVFLVNLETQHMVGLVSVCGIYDAFGDAGVASQWSRTATHHLKLLTAGSLG